MCLIGVAIEVPGPWLFVVAANRDEFHDRPTSSAGYWDRHGDAVLAGRDLRSGGTWLGMRRSAAGDSMRVAALTNLRPGLMPERPAAADAAAAAAATSSTPPTPPSRGQLVTGFLTAESSPAAFFHGLEPPPHVYAGFNLLTIALRPAATPAAPVDAWYLNNLPDSPVQRLGSGIHLVSNATLGVPWSKTVRLRTALHAALAATTDPMALRSLLFAALDDRTPAAEGELPRTGLDPARERLLSAPFIVDDTYGTRCSTVIIVTRAGDGVFCERSFDRDGRQVGMVVERFRLGAPD